MNEESFAVSPKEAIQIQHILCNQVKLEPLRKPPQLIAGCDVSMNRFAAEGYAGFVILTYPELVEVDYAVVKDIIPFPYIPGLLSFREIPMLLKAWEKLSLKPDLIVVDGVGIAHPRGLGIASHLGLVLNIPTIGCAKSVLTGVYEEPDTAQGAYSHLYNKKDKSDIIGAAVRTKSKVNPVFVSPGHRITLSESIELILATVRKHRLPEPTRQAHLKVNEYRVKGEGSWNTL